MMEKTGVFEQRLPTMLENWCNQPWVTEDDGTRVVNRRLSSMMEQEWLTAGYHR
jgi:chromosome condensin MukBEF complex kleisin-like MukF subunit